MTPVRMMPPIIPAALIGFDFTFVIEGNVTQTQSNNLDDSIYNILSSSGAGIGSFIYNISTGLFVLLCLIVIIGVIVSIGIEFANILKSYGYLK